jgi:UDP-N-acetyl-2-amino-2-deoxyglucuronate dehydrogenase
MTDQLTEHQMKFAVVGAGVIGKLHAQTITNLPGAEVGVVVDVQLERAQDLAGRHQARALSDIAAALSLPDIDAVAICTPSGEHADLVVAALRAGKHVVVEKPLDVCLAAARRVAAAERESGRWVTVISQHRFDPSALVVREALSSGRLGRVTSGSASVAWWRSQAYYDSAGWRGTWALDGGGALMNQGIHTIDLLVWFLGKPVEVFAWTGLLAHERMEVEDTAVATIRFDGGALGVIHGTTCAYPGLNARLQIHGDRGSAVIDDDELTYFHAARDGDVGPDVGAGSPDNQAAAVLPAAPRDAGRRTAGLLPTSHTAQYQDFLSSVAGDHPPVVTVAEATRTLAVISAIYESAEAGRPVLVADADGGGQPGQHRSGPGNDRRPVAP